MISFNQISSPNVYIVETIQPTSEATITNAFGVKFNNWQLNEFTIENENIKGILPSNQLLRPWDNVPKKALAQEITANRLIFANYVQNFDLRDKTLADMSELMDISVKYTGRGVANVSVGGSGIGPTIVESFNYVKMGLPERNGVLQPTINTGTSNLSTNQVSAGLLAGLVNSHGKIGNVIKDLNQLALVISQEINAQHKLGVTLDGIPGREMFSNASISATNGIANRGSVATEIEIIDALALPKNDMTVVYNEENENWTLSGLDFSTPITGNSLVKTESFRIQFSGQPKNGDVVNVSALPETALGLKFLLSRAEEFAAASPLLVSQNTLNSSEAKLEVLPAVKTENNIAVPPSIEKVLNNADAPILALSLIHI
mgnify:CR=1 FL=1